jgi:hypothetical protein
MNATITVLSPVPPAVGPGPAKEARGGLAGRVRVGLLSNGKPNTDHLLDALGDELGRDPALELSGRERKPSSSQPAPDDALERLVALSDLVVVATAD